MKLAYYPGCSSHGSAADYDRSARAVAGALALELVDVPEWNCCGASSAHGADHRLALYLPGRNLAVAAGMGMGGLVTPCAACYSRLNRAHHWLGEDRRRWLELSAAVGLPYNDVGKPRSLLEVVVGDVGLEVVAAQVRRPLKGLKAAAYYGCLMLKPPEVARFDDPENPRSMDDLLQALGAQPVRWGFKTECCGASLSVSRPELVEKLVGDILDNASAAGAECVVTACPMCQANLEQRRSERHRLPVFYFTDLAGIAFGLSPRELGIPMHLGEPLELLRGKGLLAAGEEGQG